MAVDVEVIPFEAAERHVEARRERSHHLRRQLVTADLLAGAAAGAIGASVAELPLLQLVAFAVMLAVVWPVAAFLCGLYAREDLRNWASGIGEAPKLVLTCLALSWPLLALLAAVGAPQAIPGTLATTVALAALAGFTRAGARVNVHSAPELEQRTLIVGSGEVASRLVARLGHHPELGLQPIGFVDDDPDGQVEGFPRLGQLNALHDLVRQGRVDRVMVAFTRAHHEDLLDVLRTCRDAGIAVDVVPRLFEFLDGARTMDQIGGLPLLSIDVPTFSKLSRAVKRGLDIVGSGVALIVLSPVMVVAMIAIKLDSRGSIFYTQTRPGLGGHPFRLLKFRSMTAGASAVEVGPDGAIVKSPDD